jgi:hypothetical protein
LASLWPSLFVSHVMVLAINPLFTFYYLYIYKGNNIFEINMQFTNKDATSTIQMDQLLGVNG